jgi:preprotein translocase subunit YajC
MHGFPLFSLMAPAPDGGSSGLMILLFQVAAIGAVFYFLIIRPQGQARKKHQELLAGLKKGDEVVTAGGIIGKVRDIKDNRVTVESGTATLVVERSRIIQVGDAVAPGQ